MFNCEGKTENTIWLRLSPTWPDRLRSCVERGDEKEVDATLTLSVSAFGSARDVDVSRHEGVLSCTEVEIDYMVEGFGFPVTISGSADGMQHDSFDLFY